MDKLKLGFIVEGTTDRIVVESLARRILPDTVHYQTVRLGAKAALNTAYTTVITFVQKDYEHIILLFDTDTTSETEIAEQKFRLEETLRPYQLNERTTVCPVVPEIEAWLLAHYMEQPEIFRDVKSKLTEVVGVEKLSENVLKQVIETINLELIMQRNSSFAQFVNALRLVASQPALTL